MTQVLLDEPRSGDLLTALGRDGVSRRGPVCALDAEAVGRLDVLLAATGNGRAEGPDGVWRVERRDGPPELAFGEKGFGDQALAREVLEEVAALIERLGADGAAPVAGRVLPRAWARRRGMAETPATGLRAGGPRAVEVVGVERPWAGYFAVEVLRLRHARFDGGLSPEIARATFASGDAATVLPYDPRSDRVLLIEQFRSALVARRDPLPWCLEAVAGRLDGGESPEETVRREAEEEAGIRLGRVERVAGYYPSPGVTSEFITAFVGEAALGEREGIFGLAHEDEDIRAFVVPRAEALAAAASGEINNAPLLLTLFWLELNAERLRRLWT